MDGTASTDGVRATVETAYIPAPPRPRFARAIMSVLVYVFDAVTLTSAFILGYYARLYVPIFRRPDLAPGLDAYIGVLVAHVVTIMSVFYLSRMYHLPRMVSRIDLARNILSNVTVGTVLAYGSAELLFEDTFLYVDYPQTLFFYVTIFSVILTGLGREGFRRIQIGLRQVKVDTDNLMIVGGGRVAQEIATRVQGDPALGYSVVGMVTREGKPQEAIPGVDVIGSFDQIAGIIDRNQIEQVIIALPNATREELVRLISQCQRGQVDVKVYPDMLAYMAGDLNVDDLGGTPLITVRDIALRGWKLSLKRGLDIVGAGLGLVLFSPLMLMTAAFIRWESRGPIFYTQERMGLDGRSFEVIKFRSMRTDAETSGPGWTVPDDPRVTPFGNFLRRTNWDEIPQLINVLLGEMSLVGPRPERPVYVREFRQSIPRYMERHREKAGMTGWAQVNGLRGDTSIPKRTAFDLWYVENWSLWLDIKIIIRTIWMTLTGRSINAY